MEVIKRVHVIACGVLAIDLKDIAEKLGIEVSFDFLPGGLHSSPRELRRRLQEAIDRASADHRGERIAVGYGVCGMGAVGIHARQIPLAVPRVNDCIALFLGSDAAYRQQFAAYPGTYYLSAGWVEEKAQPQASNDKTRCGEYDLEFAQLVAKHGQENADAIRYFLNSWHRNYQRAAWIDTGVPGRSKQYANLARSMAEQHGWKYEELHGSGGLLRKLLIAQESTDEILVVPPHHVTAYDAIRKTLTAVPVWQNAAAHGGEQMLVFEDEGVAASAEKPLKIGLGIDAGGTYTDVVIHDFERGQVLQKAKALTTKWDFSVGIDNALDQLDGDLLRRVELASISTTLATNAIVEGRGQKVGLVLMPPYGRFWPQDIDHRPLAVVDGKMEIDGRELAPIDPEQVRRVVEDMVQREQVGALAVVGYASHINPDHELAIAAIARDEFGLSVTCGQDVSEGASYIVRATTAILNARIIPAIESLMDQVRASLARRSIGAPIMVVRSDGSLMNVKTARQRPIETILSGPAASVAGAMFLAKTADAVVVDIGGTTTDIGTIIDGVVRTCPDGATVGGHRTHVRALDIRTRGLGGDSLITWARRRLKIGPRRVAPMAWLFAQHATAEKALAWVERHLDEFDRSSHGMDVLALNGRRRDLPLSDGERRIVDILTERPMCLQELAKRVGDTVVWEFLPLERLEEGHLVQRCGLTPTDLLHVTGQVNLWDASASRRAADVFARLSGADVEEFARTVLEQATRDLVAELVRKQLDEQGIPGDELDESKASRAILNNFLAGGNDSYQVQVRLKRPLVGIGAPVHFFLPQAAKMLGTEAIIPPNADVANAIGAITSSVCVRRQVTISPTDGGGYAIEGLSDAPKFGSFEDAHKYGLDRLLKVVRRQAADSGTRQTRVEVLIRDRVATVADGSQLFIGRTLDARLMGRPDIV